MKFINDFIGNDVGAEYNSLGHRCKEISEINLKNYILFAGDNIGLGLGTPIEKTYPYITAKNLNIDYYNLCIFNGGLDSIRHNLIAWFAKIRQKPKALIISCEFLNSLLVTDQNYDQWSTIDLNDDYVRDFINAGNNSGFFTARNVLAEKQLSNVCQIPIFQIIFKDKDPLFKNNAININHADDMFNHIKISHTLTTEVLNVTRKMMP